MKSSGGGKFVDILGRLSLKVQSAKKVQVGFMADKHYPDGTSVAFVAAMNEYGSQGFLQQDHGPRYAAQVGGTAPEERLGRPPRPFFRDMINKKSGEWPAAVAGVLRDKNFDAEATLKVVGEAIQGQLKEEITSYIGPPLAASTIAAKGFDKQLVETGTMLDSVIYKVVK